MVTPPHSSRRGIRIGIIHLAPLAVLTVSTSPSAELNNWSLMSNERPSLLFCAEPGLVSGGVDVRLVSSCIAVVGGWPAKEVSPCAITVEARE